MHRHRSLMLRWIAGDIEEAYSAQRLQVHQSAYRTCRKWTQRDLCDGLLPGTGLPKLPIQMAMCSVPIVLLCILGGIFRAKGPKVVPQALALCEALLLSVVLVLAALAPRALCSMYYITLPDEEIRRECSTSYPNLALSRKAAGRPSAAAS